MTREQQIRTEAGIAQHVAAAKAGVSPHTWKLFEANPAVLSPKKREACERALAEMEKLISLRSVA